MVWFLSFAVIVTAVAAISDTRTGLIPNRITLPVIGIAPVFHAIAASHLGLRAALYAALLSIGGMFLCAVIPFFCFRAGAMGGGDVKLLAAIGALCLPSIGIEAEAYGFCAGAFIAGAKLAYEGRLLKTLGGGLRRSANFVLPFHHRFTIPPDTFTWFRLGPALFLGTALAVFLHSR